MSWGNVMSVLQRVVQVVATALPLMAAAGMIYYVVFERQSKAEPPKAANFASNATPSAGPPRSIVSAPPIEVDMSRPPREMAEAMFRRAVALRDVNTAVPSALASSALVHVPVPKPRPKSLGGL